MNKKMNKGLRDYQTEKVMDSQISILRVLSYDEDFHQYSELREKTKLSDATLSKRLKQLKKMKLIEKNIDTESGRYPYPVFYRLNPVYANAFRADTRDKHTQKIMKEKLLENRNPLEIMQEINKDNNLVLLGILLSLKENKNIDEKIKRLLLELLLWKPYKSLTWSLVEETERIIGTIDIKKLVWEV